MRTDSRLSRVLHVMLHMARNEAPSTSDEIAAMLGTNPVVVRRTMAGLREAGYIATERGPGGGWVVSADLNRLTLLDVYEALGRPRLFAIGADNENATCAVERSVNAALGGALDEAGSLILERLGATTIADLATRFDTICRAEGWEERRKAMQAPKRRRHD